jgi:hypothetical protein
VGSSLAPDWKATKCIGHEMSDLLFECSHDCPGIKSI